MVREINQVFECEVQRLTILAVQNSKQRGSNHRLWRLAWRHWDGQIKELKFCSRVTKQQMIICQDLCLPMCREGKPINSAAVDILHLRWLRSQEVLHRHSAKLITWGTKRSDNPTRTDCQFIVSVNQYCAARPYQKQWCFCGGGAKLQWWGSIWGTRHLRHKQREQWNMHNQKRLCLDKM